MASDLQCVNAWLHANKLTLNIIKTEYMLIKSKQKRNHLPFNPSPSTNGAPIKKVPVAKLLRVFVDENLSWDTHVDKVSKKFTDTGAIKGMKPFVLLQTFLTIFNALAQPHFKYCNVVWGNCSKGLKTL